jgi:hypothetical protein
MRVRDDTFGRTGFRHDMTIGVSYTANITLRSRSFIQVVEDEARYV